MKRHQLEHVLRAASRIADEPDVLVIGSQAIPTAPEQWRRLASDHVRSHPCQGLGQLAPPPISLIETVSF